MQIDIISQIVLPISLFIIMLGMGLNLTINDFKQVLKQPKALSIGLAAQLILLPAVAVMIIWLFQLSAELAVGMIIIALCPGGTTSNMFSYLAKGDTALSISLTAAVSLITPFTIPVVTVVAMGYFLEQGSVFSLPILKTIIQLFLITIVPVGLGMLIFKRFPLFARKAEKPVKIFSIVFLLLIIAAITVTNKTEMLNYFAQTGLATLMLNTSTLLLGYWLAKAAKLENKQAIAIGIEVGIQNGTLALLIAGTLIGSSIMTIPAITYSLTMFVTGAGFAWLVSQHSKSLATQ